MEPNFSEKEITVGSRVIIETLYNGISVFIDKETGYYSASKICRDCKKRFENLAQNQDYELMKQAISAATGIPVAELIVVFKGMPSGFQGRWVHPLLVNTVCEWASKRYAVQVSMLMNEKAKQAIIEKKTLQEQIDRERIHTERLEDELNEAKDSYRQVELHYTQESKAHEETKAILNDIRAKLDASAQREQQLIAQNEHTHQELAQAHAQRDAIQAQNVELQTTVNNLHTTVNRLHDVIVDSGQMLHDTVQSARDTVLERFTQANVTTSSRLETIDVWKIRALDEYYHRTHQCEDNEHVLDTYCGDASKPSRINQHRFKPQASDELVGSYSNANAIDLAVYLRRHQAEYPHVRMDSNRKLIYSDDELDEVKALLIAYSRNGDGVISAVVDGFEASYQEASNDLITRLQAALQPIVHEEIAQVLEQEQAHHQEQMHAIEQAEANVIEAVAPIVALLYQLHPNASLVYFNHAYRELIIQNDRVYCRVLKNSNQLHELTEDELRRLRFRAA